MIGESPKAKNTPLQLMLFGEFSMRMAEQVIPLETTSYQSLLAYLVVHAEQPQTRQHLAFLIWPESTEKQARTNLRKALYALRRTFPAMDCYLQVNRQTVCWHPVRPVTVDVAIFQAALRRAQEAGKGPGRITALEEVISTYYGDFLPGLFDEWILAQRERWQAHYVAALEDLILAYEGQREYPTAIQHARRLLRVDPLHEATYRRLMRLQSLAGNVAGALQVYHTCFTRLQQDLGVTPSEATQRTYERLLQRKAAVAALPTASVPLVGREAAWQSLQQAWKRVHRGPPLVVFMQGEAGIGKTRLAEEMLDWATRQGIAVLAANCYRAEQQLAYAPVARWLRTETMQPQLARSATRLQVECSRLLPELLVQQPVLPEPRPLTESWQRQHFFSALAQVILPVCRPGLLFIDDLHSSDGDTLEWLQFLLRYKGAARFLLLVTARSEELTPDHPLHAWPQELAQDGRLITLSLSGLNRPETAQLAGHVLRRELNDQQAAYLYAETEGNPFFIVEMARSNRYEPDAASDHESLPPRIQSVIAGLLAALTPAAYELAQLAATIGRSFTFSLLEQACVQDGDQLVNSLDELWQRRILREQGWEAYDFRHDKIRQVAYASLNNARRRQTHFRVAQALEKVYAANLAPVSGQIAAHYVAAGRAAEALPYYRRAAQEAQAIYAHQETIQYLEKAIALFDRVHVPEELQAKIYDQLGEACLTSGRGYDAATAFQTALALSTGRKVRSALQRQLAQVWLQQRRFEASEQALQMAAEIMGAVTDDRDVAWWREWLDVQLDFFYLCYWTGRLAEMVAVTDTLQPLVEEKGSAQQRGRFYQALGMLTFRRHRYVVPVEAVHYMRASLAEIVETGNVYQEAFSHFALGFAYFLLGWHGSLDQAEEALLAALELAEEIGDPVVQCRSRAYLGLVYRKRGDVARVANEAPLALALAEETQMSEYIASALGQMAWVAWQKGDLSRAQELGEQAFQAGEQYPVPIPIKWPWLWPLIAVSLEKNDPAGALPYAKMLLAPTHQRVHDDVASQLELALAAGEENRPEAAQPYLETALELAHTLLYL